MPKDFFADIVSMKSRLLHGVLRFWKHAPALEIFWPKLLDIYNKLSLGRITFTKNMKRFGGILLAVELYTFDQFLGVFWSFF